MAIFDQLSTPNKDQQRLQMARMGVTLAKVTNITDPEKKGRVKCEFITANKEAKELDWAYVMTPFGGKKCGFYFMPNLDDIVLVTFDGGDIRRPYIIGSLWGSINEAPLALADGKNEKYQISTPNQNVIELGDKKGEESITIKTPKGLQAEFKDKDQKIEITDGANSISLDGKGGEVKIKCKSKLTIEIGTGAKITIDGNAGSIKLESNQAINIESTQVNVTAKSNAVIKGNAQVQVEGGGMTQIKGGMLKLN